ncbi:hypothetical protein MKZ02_22020 [Pseudobacillus sp. FSL P4-0506]|uniref:hypothetical protein n=1 Tax=Pseudobacillus sp. FSL P4-0506 TaxID=2921576 RepID=UPI0030FCAF11
MKHKVGTLVWISAIITLFFRRDDDTLMLEMEDNTEMKKKKTGITDCFSSFQWIY